MAAESGGPAAFDRVKNLHMLRGDPLAAAFDERLPRGADDIGHLGLDGLVMIPGPKSHSGKLRQCAQRLSSAAARSLRAVRWSE